MKSVDGSILLVVCVKTVKTQFLERTNTMPMLINVRIAVVNGTIAGSGSVNAVIFHTKEEEELALKIHEKIIRVVDEFKQPGSVYTELVNENPNRPKAVDDNI